jgi:hypothetical protein
VAPPRLRGIQLAWDVRRSRMVLVGSALQGNTLESYALAADRWEPLGVIGTGGVLEPELVSLAVNPSNGTLTVLLTNRESGVELWVLGDRTWSHVATHATDARSLRVHTFVIDTNGEPWLRNTACSFSRWNDPRGIAHGDIPPSEPTYALDGIGASYTWVRSQNAVLRWGGMWSGGMYRSGFSAVMSLCTLPRE